MNRSHLALFSVSLALASCSTTSVVRHDAFDFERTRLWPTTTTAAPSTTAATTATTTAATAGATTPLPRPPQHSDNEGWDGSIQGMFGGRMYENDTFWDPLEDQASFMLEFEARPEDFPLGIEVGVGFAIGFEDDFLSPGTDVFGSASEFYVGPRFTVDTGVVRPYVAAGIVGLNSRIDVQQDFAADVDDSDATVGGYVHGGVLFDIGSFSLGADIRHVYGTDIELFGVPGDVDYLQLSLVFGGTF